MYLSDIEEMTSVLSTIHFLESNNFSEDNDYEDANELLEENKESLNWDIELFRSKRQYISSWHLYKIIRKISIGNGK